MATSSITHNFVITTPEGVERFLKAIDEAEREKRQRPKEPPLPGRHLTDPYEIKALTERWMKNTCQKDSQP